MAPSQNQNPSYTLHYSAIEMLGHVLCSSSPFGMLIRYPTGVGLFAFLRYASILAILSLSTGKISAHSWAVKVRKSSVCLLVNITVWYLELGRGLTEEKTVPPSVNRDLS